MDIMAKMAQRGEKKERPLEMWLLEDCTLAQLMDPGMAADAVQFVALEVWSRW